MGLFFLDLIIIIVIAKPKCYQMLLSNGLSEYRVCYFILHPLHLSSGLTRMQMFYTKKVGAILRLTNFHLNILFLNLSPARVAPCVGFRGLCFSGLTRYALFRARWKVFIPVVGHWKHPTEYRYISKTKCFMVSTLERMGLPPA